MIDWASQMACGLGVLGLSGEGEVVEVGDTEHRVVNAVAHEAAVAQDLPSLHSSEGVLNAGADLAV